MYHKINMTGEHTVHVNVLYNAGLFALAGGILATVAGIIIGTAAGLYGVKKIIEGGQSTSTPITQPLSDEGRECIEADYKELIKKCINKIKDMKPILEEREGELKKMKEVLHTSK